MRYNKQELFALASQTSQNFDREGVLVLKERQDGFFRRSEGCSVRWFRLRGNLLFYLKGPEPWYEPVGVIVLGHHEIKLQTQDENGHWPFQIVWDNGVCYRLATFHESERTLWLKGIQMASYDYISKQIAALQENLNKIRPVIDIASYRMQKGIIIDLNEVPLCELTLSCDNLLCNAYGLPPSPMVVVYFRYPNGLSVKYGATEIVDTCSNPSFSKTIQFRASDGLTGDSYVRLVVYDVKDRVSGTVVPMGYTSLQLSTIQEAQRLRVPLNNSDGKTVGFVTINGWSLEPSCSGSSPMHTNDKNCMDIPQKVLSHRRSQSLPPRLGLKLKYPSFCSLMKQNFVNCHQVTYRFHSGLGGDITVHEIMAESKLCYHMPMQLLDIYIHQEKDLLEELLSVGDMIGPWQNRRMDLINIHISMLKLYCHSKRCMEQADSSYFKPSNRKDEAGLEFAPVNLHLQRMWVHNDTLNRTGFHDVVTAGAFAAHTHNAERTGGLIRLVQQVKDVNSSKVELNSATNRIQADYENVLAMERMRYMLLRYLDRTLCLLPARSGVEVMHAADDIKCTVFGILSLWDHRAVEESLSYIGWPKFKDIEESESEMLPSLVRLNDTLNMMALLTTAYDNFASSSSSSKEASPTGECPTLASSVPNICPYNINNYKDMTAETMELQFHYDYFKSVREERSSLHHSFRSVRSRPRLDDTHSLSFESSKTRHGSLSNDFKCSVSLEQVSYRSLLDNLGMNDKRKNSARRESVPLPAANHVDPAQRKLNLSYFENFTRDLRSGADSLLDALTKHYDGKGDTTEKGLKNILLFVKEVKSCSKVLAHYLRVAHAALRLRYEAPQFAREQAALQTRRDTCFSQALTTVTTGLLCWLCTAPADVIVKLIVSELGPLCAFEGLLSLYSTEKAMWGDMVVAVEDLQMVVFTLVKVGHSNSAMPQVTGTRRCLVVQLPVPDSLYSRFSENDNLSFTITAVLFNIGVNEKATLAEALGETTPQFHSNGDNLDRITNYYHKYTKIFPPDHAAATRASSRTKPLEEVMENLRIVVQRKVPKNVEVLHLSALATRLMNGVRFTSCKSAKDRTGMAVTLEQCRILASDYHLADNEMEKALNIMRSNGCRRENTLKNIGVAKYAFTKKQVMALPEDYRPPPGTYGSSQT